MARGEPDHATLFGQNAAVGAGFPGGDGAEWAGDGRGGGGGGDDARLRVAGFAAAWRAALAAARARVAAELLRAEVAAGAGVVGTMRNVQIARPAGRLTGEQEDAFLDMLAASANVRLSARAAGASVQGFYARRLRDARFREAWAAAAECGRERLSLMLVEAACRRFDPEGDLRMRRELGLVGGGEGQEGLTPVSVDETIRILGIGRAAEARARREAWRRPVRPIEEVRDSIMAKIALIARQGEGTGEGGAKAAGGAA